MYTENELLFPPYVIPHLRHSRGEKWKSLVRRVMDSSEQSKESLAFSLTMIRLDGCLSCETDSYRAMRGCHACALQTLRRYKGTDSELLELYHQSLKDVEIFLNDTSQDTFSEQRLQAKAA
jgi:hypothetical protein